MKFSNIFVSLILVLSLASLSFAADSCVFELFGWCIIQGPPSVTSLAQPQTNTTSITQGPTSVYVHPTNTTPINGSATSTYTRPQAGKINPSTGASNHPSSKLLNAPNPYDVVPVTFTPLRDTFTISSTGTDCSNTVTYTNARWIQVSASGCQVFGGASNLIPQMVDTFYFDPIGKSVSGGTVYPANQASGTGLTNSNSPSAFNDVASWAPKVFWQVPGANCYYWANANYNTNSGSNFVRFDSAGTGNGQGEFFFNSNTVTSNGILDPAKYQAGIMMLEDAGTVGTQASNQVATTLSIVITDTLTVSDTSTYKFLPASATLSKVTYRGLSVGNYATLQALDLPFITERGTQIASVTATSAEYDVATEIAKPRFYFYGDSGPFTHAFDILITDTIDKQLQNRVTDSGADIYATGLSTADTGATPLSPVRGVSAITATTQGRLFRMGSAQFLEFADYATTDTQASGFSYNEQQNFWIGTGNSNPVAFDPNDKQVEVNKYDLAAYNSKFLGNDYGIQVCTGGLSSSDSWSSCPVYTNTRTDFHRMKINFMGDTDWIISMLSPPSATLSSSTSAVAGGAVKLAKESAYGILNISGTLNGGALKARLSDVSSAYNTPAVFDILDSSNMVLTQLTVTPGNTVGFTSGSNTIKVHVYQDHNASSLQQKWAEVAIYSEEIALYDGYRYNQANATDANKDFYVSLLWKNRDYTGSGSSTQPDSLREITVYQYQNFVRAKSGDTYNFLPASPYHLQYAGIAAVAGNCSGTNQSNCTDSDGGLNYFTAGVSTGDYAGAGSGTPVIIWVNGSLSSSPYNYSIYYDNCVSIHQLNEGYCDQNGILQAVGVNCPSGTVCSNGACMQNQTNQSVCTMDNYTCTSAGGIWNSVLGECMCGPSRALQTTLTCPSSYTCIDLHNAMPVDGFGVCCAANKTFPDYYFDTFGFLNSFSTGPNGLSTNVSPSAISVTIKNKGTAAGTVPTTLNIFFQGSTQTLAVPPLSPGQSVVLNASLPCTPTGAFDQMTYNLNPSLAVVESAYSNNVDEGWHVLCNVSNQSNQTSGDCNTVFRMYSDFQCPYCGTFARNTLPQLKASYPDVLYAFRNFPLPPSFHAYAQKAAEAAACARRQGKYWEMQAKLFNNQNALDVPSLKDYAIQLGLNSTRFNACLDNGEAANQVSMEKNEGISLNVSGTPSTYIYGPYSPGLESRIQAFMSQAPMNAHAVNLSNADGLGYYATTGIMIEGALPYSSFAGAMDAFKCNVTPSQGCHETDGGDNWYQAGTTTGLQVNGAYQVSNSDYCTNSTHLVEYFCDDVFSGYPAGHVNNAIYACPNGCSNGACIQNQSNQSGCACGTLSTPNSVCTLTQDLTTNGTCFKVMAQNITIDCAGHSITGANMTGAYGVFSNQVGTSVKNCNMKNFYQDAVNFNGATYGKITNTTVSTVLYAISLESSSHNTISNVVATASEYYAFALSQSSNNIITDSKGTAPSFVVMLDSNSNGNTFLRNSFTGSNGWILSGTFSGNTFNDSSVGNAYYFANGTGAWQVYNITDTNGNNYADTGTGLPFNHAKLGANWQDNGNEADWHPYTLNSGNKTNKTIIIALNNTIINATPFNPCAKVSCASGYACSNGQCISTDPCATVKCASGYTCTKGVCIATTPVDPCATVRCSTGYACSNGACVSTDPCATVACRSGYACSNGQCISTDPCAKVSCASGYACSNGQCISTDPCATVRCTSGYACSNGTCVSTDPCATVACRSGYACSNGQCISTDPCATVRCTSGYACSNGTCIITPIVAQPSASADAIFDSVGNLYSDILAFFTVR